MIHLVDEYSDYIDNLQKHIKNSPFKTSFFLEKLEIPKASFYRKLREKTFTVGEVQRITHILFPKESYKEELLKSLEQGRADIDNEKLISSKDMRSAMRKKLATYQ